MIPCKLISSICLIALTVLLAACSAFSTGSGSLAAHPEKLPTGRPLCSECHTAKPLPGGIKSYDSFDHDKTFIADHRTIAAQNGRVCATCHAESFCVDCHAAKTEIKPSTMFGNRPDREQIHQGDFLTRHRFEGRSDPTSCYSCHGRANNESCRRCH